MKQRHEIRERMELQVVVSCVAAEAASRSIAEAPKPRHPTDGRRSMLERRVVHLM